MQYHSKPYFLDSSSPPITVLRGGQTAVRAVLLPHASTRYIDKIVSTMLDDLDFDSFDQILWLTTNHQDSSTYTPSSSILQWKNPDDDDDDDDDNPPLRLRLLSPPTSWNNWNNDGSSAKKKEDLLRKDDFFYREHSYLSFLPYIASSPVAAFREKPFLLLAVGADGDPDALARTIHEWMEKEKEEDGKRTLIVANTDLLHCGKEGYGVACPSSSSSSSSSGPEWTDRATIRSILERETNTLGPRAACGLPVLRLLSSLLKQMDEKERGGGGEGIEWTTMAQSSSRDQGPSSSPSFNNNNNYVGYAGIRYGGNESESLSSPPSSLLRIPAEIAAYLLRDKKKYAYFCSRPVQVPIRKLLSLPPYVEMKDVVGIFVTVEEKETGDLRGCLGTFQMDPYPRDVVDAIVEQTFQSLCADPRFSPATIEELPFLKYKINFLKKPFRASPPLTEENLSRQFRPGVHGLTALFSDGKRATYLPSVLLSFSSIDEILQSLRKKAGSRGNLSAVEFYDSKEYNVID